MVAPLALAGIQAGASILGGITGGKGAKKAAKIAAQSAAADRAQAQQIYNTNVGLAQPTVDRGNAAGAQINALLGLGGDAGAANDALAAWRGSTGYQTGLTQGYNGLNTSYAARGALESGAAQKAILKYGADYANQNFGQYVGLLQGQQGAGQNALGSVTGAGNAYASQMTAANGSSASAAANAALSRGNAWQGALGGVADALGKQFGQSSYGTRDALASPLAYPNTYGPNGSLYNSYGVLNVGNPWGR